MMHCLTGIVNTNMLFFLQKATKSQCHRVREKDRVVKQESNLEHTCRLLFPSHVFDCLPVKASPAPPGTEQACTVTVSRVLLNPKRRCPYTPYHRFFSGMCKDKFIGHSEVLFVGWKPWQRPTGIVVERFKQH